jgi:hypothetical protein
MKKPKQRVLLPAALVVSACSGPPPRPPCGGSPYDVCMPDGGYYCMEMCAPALQDDGGLYLINGQVDCLC